MFPSSRRTALCLTFSEPPPFPCCGVCVNMPVIWIFDILSLWMKVASRWRFIILVNFTQVYSMDALYRGWLHCVGCGISVFRCASSKDSMPLNRWYKTFLYKRALWDQIRSHSGCDVLEVSPYSGLLCCPFHLFYVIDSGLYWWLDCAFECRLCTHQRLSLIDSCNTEICAMVIASRLFYYVREPCWWGAFEGYSLLLARHLLSFCIIFIVYSTVMPGCSLHVAVSNFSICSFRSFLY